MDWNFYLFIQNPAYQALLFLLFTPALIFAIQPKSADKAWLIVTFIFSLFLLMNAILLWFNSNPWHYFFYSIGFAWGYILLIYFIMTWLTKVLHLKSSDESAMALLIVIYQPFALLLVMLAKKLATWYFS